MKLTARYGLIGLLGSLLSACAMAPDTDRTTVQAPPPDLATLPLESPDTASDTEIGTQLSSQAQPELRQTQARAFLPGLAASDAQAEAPPAAEAEQGKGETPFELELQQQRKRIHLGLETEQREQNPVDNVVNLGF